MKVVHLTASRFFGGPERQMLELGKSLRPECTTTFASFSETGLCRGFLERARRAGFCAVALQHDTPRLLGAVRELALLLRTEGATILCCHGYKANLIGLLAARGVGVPVVSVSRGWTGESSRVRFYEWLDRFVLRWMDRVVCVAEGQAAKVRAAGVREEKIEVVHNAVRLERFARPGPDARQELEAMFPEPPRLLVGAAGRLSPEKGFGVLIEAAAEVTATAPRVGFVLFGDGALRGRLEAQVREHGLEHVVVLAGFCSNLDHYLPHFDLVVIPSYTEGLSNVGLEAMAAGVPVVATAVGGNPELIQDGVNGRLVPPNDSASLARGIAAVLSDAAGRKYLGEQGRGLAAERFSFDAQARKYLRLVHTLTSMTAVDEPPTRSAHSRAGAVQPGDRAEVTP